MLEPISRIAILGVGLIGGSIGLALRARGYAGRIAGFNRNPEEGRQALAVGAVDASLATPIAAVKDADLILLCVPPGVMPALMAEIAAHCLPDALVSDVGSVKTSIVAAGEALFGGRFVGGHPIAGKEQHGVGAAAAGLFADSRCVLTPTARTQPQALALVHALWADLGCTVLDMPPQAHDEALALTSHLPHILAFSLMAQFAAQADLERLAPLTGGGFRDFSRIASSDPALWADISLQNKAALLSGLAAYQAQLETFKTLLAQESHEQMQIFFQHAKTTRERILALRNSA